MKCIRQSRKKYTSRKSPPYSASDCKGMTLKGNDGVFYISTPNKDGVFTWKPAAAPPKKFSVTRKVKTRRYETHNNGGRPFAVYVYPSFLEIYKLSGNDSDSETFLQKFAYSKIWIGNDDAVKDSMGNSILAQIGKNMFLSIGEDVYTFGLFTGDNVIKYVSTVGPNDVVYAYLVGTNHTYFIHEREAVENKLLHMDDTIYGQYFGHVPARVENLRDYLKKVPHKVLV